jgi:hypothetical protein
LNTSEGVAGGCYFLRSPSVFLFYFCAHHPVLTIVDVAEEGKGRLGSAPDGPGPHPRTSGKGGEGKPTFASETKMEPGRSYDCPPLVTSPQLTAFAPALVHTEFGPGVFRLLTCVFPFTSAALSSLRVTISLPWVGDVDIRGQFVVVSCAGGAVIQVGLVTWCTRVRY